MQKPWLSSYPSGVPHDIHPEEFRSPVTSAGSIVQNKCQRAIFGLHGSMDDLS